MNSDAVKAKIVFNGMKIDEFISLVNHELSNNGYSGMSRSTYYKNLRGEQEFSRSEIQAISKVLNLSDEEVLNIFLINSVLKDTKDILNREYNNERTTITNHIKRKGS